ncbi:hypothetical protein FRX31_013892, partial [Thalictrum thalictroides]
PKLINNRNENNQQQLLSLSCLFACWFEFNLILDLQFEPETKACKRRFWRKNQLRLTKEVTNKVYFVVGIAGNLLSVELMEGVER